jgi:hypothetical protein
VWIIIGLGVIALAVLAVFFFPWRLGDDRDLGTISHQWLAEHRNHTQ